jgi:hypothetical protein
MITGAVTRVKPATLKIELKVVRNVQTTPILLIICCGTLLLRFKVVGLMLTLDADQRPQQLTFLIGKLRGESRRVKHRLTLAGRQLFQVMVSAMHHFPSFQRQSHYLLHGAPKTLALRWGQALESLHPLQRSFPDQGRHCVQLP